MEAGNTQLQGGLVDQPGRYPHVGSRGRRLKESLHIRVILGLY